MFKCERDGIYYAIKIISIPSTDNELDQLLSRYELDAVKESLREKVEYYRREIRLMAELKGNRNIVNIEDYQVVESNDGLHFYIVIRMELLTSLTSYSSKNVLTQNDIIRMGIDICDALIICEKHNIIHRDIKPENILLHSDGAFKVGDFGVAKQLSKTTAGTIAGTEGFMAPEVSRGMEYGHTADIYSLGIVLYYFLNNKKMPFVAPNNKSIIAEQEAIIKRMSYTDVLPLPPNCSEGLGKIVVKACMFDKNCRYHSAADMRADLVSVLNGEDVTVDIVPATERGTIVQTNPKSGISSANVRNVNSYIYTPFIGDIVDKTSEERAKSRNKSTDAFDDIIIQKKNPKRLIVAIAVVCVVALISVGFIAYYKTNANSIFMNGAFSITSISIESNPTKTLYYVGDELDTSGLSLKVSYSNGTTKTITSGFTCFPTNLSTEGTQKINVSYGGKSTSFNVKVDVIGIKSLSIDGDVSVYIGEYLPSAEIPIKVTYTDGSSKVITSGYTWSEFDNNDIVGDEYLTRVGTHIVEISYGGVSDKIEINAKHIDDNHELFRTLRYRTGHYWFENASGTKTVYWCLSFDFTYASDYEENDMTVACSWEGPIERLSDNVDGWDLKPSKSTRWSYGQGATTDMYDLVGYKQLSCFDIFLPDDPSIEGRQSITITVGNQTKTIYFNLIYEGGYKTGSGWSIKDFEY